MCFFFTEAGAFIDDPSSTYGEPEVPSNSNECINGYCIYYSVDFNETLAKESDLALIFVGAISAEG